MHEVTKTLIFCVIYFYLRWNIITIKNQKLVFVMICVVTCRAGFAYPSRIPEFNHCFSRVRVAWSLALWVMFCRSLFVLFLLAIVFIVCPSIYGFWLPLWYLRFTASDYPFGILDLRLLITSLVSSNFSYNTSNIHYSS